MSSDDSDFKLAIALSATEPKRAVGHQVTEPIVISSDEDETPASQSKPIEKVGAPAGPSKIITSEGTNRFLSERAQLEAARLARLQARNAAPTTEKSNNATSASSSTQVKHKQKRKRAAATIRERDPDDPFVSSASDSDSDVIALSKNKKQKFSVKVSSKPNANAASSSSSRTAIEESEPMYWSGELRQTGNMHVDPEKDTRPVFRLHDILGNLSWIYSLFPPDVPVIIVGQPGVTGASSVHNVLPNWVKVTPFMPNGRGAMHVKFLMLFYKSGRLRIAIPTANLVDYDWRDIENSVWLQDFPLRQAPGTHDRTADDFPSHFERLLQAMNVPAGLRAIMHEQPAIPFKDVKGLRTNWDFSKVTAHLVPSIAGKHEGWQSVLRVGHTRLMRVVRLIGARADPKNPKSRNRKGERKLQLECQGSSIGTYTPAWLDEFYTSAKGASPESWLDEGKTRRSKRLEGILLQEGWKPWTNIKVLFPSLKTVMDSTLGPDGAGTMFCRRSQWTGPKFPRPLFYDSNSRRGRVLMHSKMILATFPESLLSSSESTAASASATKPGKLPSPSESSDDSATEVSSSQEDEDNGDGEIQEVDLERNDKVLGWIYVGSHNFTPSAWGYLSGTGFTPSLSLTNFELGIVLPITSPQQVETYPCWVRPPRKYGKDDEPWIQSMNE